MFVQGRESKWLAHAQQMFNNDLTLKVQHTISHIYGLCNGILGTQIMR